MNEAKISNRILTFVETHVSRSTLFVLTLRNDGHLETYKNESTGKINENISDKNNTQITWLNYEPCDESAVSKGNEDSS